MIRKIVLSSIGAMLLFGAGILVGANKFGQPKGFITRTNDYRDIPSLWWIDAEKSRRFAEAMRDESVQLGEGPSEDKYWLEFTRIEEQQNPVDSTR